MELYLIKGLVVREERTARGGAALPGAATCPSNGREEVREAREKYVVYMFM